MNPPIMPPGGLPVLSPAKRPVCRAVSLLVAAALSSLAGGLPPTVKIMPLGDSITRGNNDINYPNGDIPGGYRKNLGALLEAAHFSYDFVGDRTDNAAQGTDPDHNGNPGWRTDELLAQLPVFLSKKPQIVLLMAGTNDILQRIPVATAVANLDSLITNITANAPDRKLYVATIVPITQKWPPQGQSSVSAAILNADADDYNTQLRALVLQHAGQGRDVTLVDLNAQLGYQDPENPANNFYQPGDGIHPGQAGYDQMATLWDDAITASGSLLPAAPGTPAAPSGLTATVASPTRINLSWADNAADELVYQIYRKAGDDGDWEPVATLDADSTGHAIAGLETGVRTYGFAVRGGNAMGYSLWSNVAFSPGHVDRALSKPAGASTEAGVNFAPPNANNGDVNNIWKSEDTDPSPHWQVDLESDHQIQQVHLITQQLDDVEGTRKNFEIQGSDDPSFATFSVLASQGSTPLPHATTWSADIEDPAPYRYLRVAKTDGDAFAFALVNVCGAESAPIPAAPSGLTASAPDAKHVALKWTVNSSEESGFKLERKTGPGGAFEEVAVLPAAANSFTDSGLAALTTYHYRLRSSNATGDSAFTSEAIALTGATASYDLWSAKFPAFDALPPADREPDADPNGDGVSNLIAYAIGADPLATAHAMLPAVEAATPGELVFRFRRNKLAPDLETRVRASNTMTPGTWQDQPFAGATRTPVAGDPDSEIVSVPLIPDPEAPNRFLRLRVVKN